MTIAQLIEFISNLNLFSFLGLAVVCATYAYTQRLRTDHHNENKDWIASPDRTPEQLAAFMRAPTHPLPGPKVSNTLKFLIVLFTAGLALRAASSVVVAREKLDLNQRTATGDVDKRPNGLFAGTP